MSDQVSFDTASQLFDTEVNLQYQNSQYLANTVVERHGTTGDATNIPLSGVGEMTQGTFAAANIPVSQLNQTNNLAVPKNFYYKTAINGGYRTLFAYDQIVEQARTHSLAAARMSDAIKINTLYAYVAANPSAITQIAYTVGDNLGINSAKMASALSTLENNGVDVLDNTSMWLPALLKQAMLNDDKVVSMFYNNVKPLTNNVVSMYLGVDIRTLGEAGVNKIPSTVSGSGIRQWLVPIVAENSIVQIWNRDISTSITYIEQEDRYELLTKATTGAVIVQPNGIVLMQGRLPYAA